MTRAGRLFVAAILPVAVGSQTPTVERFTVEGNRVAVHNVVGTMTLEPGTGDAVVVEVTRNGNDARRLIVQRLTDDGRTALCIVYPTERIIYRPPGVTLQANTSTTSEGECRGGVKGLFGGRKIEIRSRGDGVEVWANVRVLVPPGRDVKVWNVAGTITATNVDATLELHSASAPIVARNTRGALDIHSDNGSVSVTAHTGDLSIDVVSADIAVDSVRSAKTIALTSATGHMRADALESDQFRVKSPLGAAFTNLRTHSVRVATATGDASLGFAIQVDSLVAESTAGPLTLVFPAGLGAELEIESVSGAITTDFPVNPPHTKRSELRGTIGDGHAKVVIQTGSGDVRLRKR